MTLFAILRHGPTAWSAEGRLQGCRDLPLSAEGRRRVAAWCLPSDLAGCAWRVSPLRRAGETATVLGISDAVQESALTEMDWGKWEGHRLAELRASVPGMAAMEAAGLDFRPPGGESPREVQARLRPLLARIAQDGAPVAAVAHKGVIRALLALATGWDMRAKSPQRLAEDTVHLFEIDRSGRPTVCRLNLPLAR
ncbi:MAG TPA: histidine phosphatase family protein [Stellaceae bacterium]|nr:histidine phosphatase family protein [Stellaceae bacterium]